MKKQTLVLIPGTLNDENLWRDQVNALSDIADCIVPDITQDDTIGAMAVSVFAEVASPSFALAGFSLGGFVAQEMLRQQPERVERLAMINTTYLPDTPEQAKQRRMVTDMARLPGHFIGIGNQMLKSYLHPSHWLNNEMTERVQTMTRNLGADVLIRQNTAERQDGTQVLKAFHRPTLIISGKEDQIRSYHLSEEMAQLMPQAELVVIENAGHLTPIEQPEIVNVAMRDWLART